MHITDVPHIFPAATLHGRTAGPVVDTGCDLPAGGRVYIDLTEATEIARLFGFVPATLETETRARLDATIASKNVAEQHTADVMTLVKDAPSVVQDYFKAAGIAF